MGAKPMAPEIPWQLRMFNKSLKKQQKLETLRDHLPDLQGKLCLLITCGDNNGAMNYCIREWGGKWIWADLENTNINEIEELLKEPIMKVDKATCKLPFPGEYFDYVMTIDCHEHLTDPSLLNEELWRITKTTGKVIVTVPNGNARKIAVRIKHLIGMNKDQYGHVVIGYETKDLHAMLKKVGFRSFVNSSYSKFFTEMIELCINFLYVKVLTKNKVAAGEKTIAPVTKDQLQSVAKTYKFYSILYPFLWSISQLDTLLFFTTGHAVVVEARKG
jgi:2-polyprenyl-3-methyl-5-hydroxy-6-metoxy-1,4-benzoquinol methylase